jgi:hypothetical protein
MGEWATNARAIAAATPPWHVIIAARDQTKSQEAAHSIITDTKNSQVAVIELNLGSLVSVRRLATEFAVRAASNRRNRLQCGNSNRPQPPRSYATSCSHTSCRDGSRPQVMTKPV